MKHEVVGHGIYAIGWPQKGGDGRYLVKFGEAVNPESRFTSLVLDRKNNAPGEPSYILKQDRSKSVLPCKDDALIIQRLLKGFCESRGGERISPERYIMDEADFRDVQKIIHAAPLINNDLEIPEYARRLLDQLTRIIPKSLATDFHYMILDPRGIHISMLCWRPNAPIETLWLSMPLRITEHLKLAIEHGCLEPQSLQEQTDAFHKLGLQIVTDYVAEVRACLERGDTLPQLPEILTPHRREIFLLGELYQANGLLERGEILQNPILDPGDTEPQVQNLMFRFPIPHEPMSRHGIFFGLSCRGHVYHDESTGFIISYHRVSKSEVQYTAAHVEQGVSYICSAMDESVFSLLEFLNWERAIDPDGKKAMRLLRLEKISDIPSGNLEDYL